MCGLVMFTFKSIEFYACVHPLMIKIYLGMFSFIPTVKIDTSFHSRNITLYATRYIPTIYLTQIIIVPYFLMFLIHQLLLLEQSASKAQTASISQLFRHCQYIYFKNKLSVDQPYIQCSDCNVCGETNKLSWHNRVQTRQLLLLSWPLRPSTTFSEFCIHPIFQPEIANVKFNLQS